MGRVQRKESYSAFFFSFFINARTVQVILRRQTTVFPKPSDNQSFTGVITENHFIHSYEGFISSRHLIELEILCLWYFHFVCVVKSY